MEYHQGLLEQSRVRFCLHGRVVSGRHDTCIDVFHPSCIDRAIIVHLVITQQMRQ